jgi:glycosyltransferase involved in cell wall biosynthesis
MIRLLINGVAATAGGGLTYLRNVIPQLAGRTDTQTAVLLNPILRAEFEAFPNVAFAEIPGLANANKNSWQRFIREQTALPHLIRQNRAQVLISTGNFALWNSPVPQILLSRNSLYTSTDFLRDLRRRRDYSIWVDTVVKGWLAKRSISRADITVAPSEAFAEELRHWTGKKVIALHHGFDPDAFSSDPTPLSAATADKLNQAHDSLRLLFVSHYNYYRNFETLFRAMPILSNRFNSKVKLFLTCQLQSQKNPGSYRAETAASLARSASLGNDSRPAENIVELGAVPYRSLHHLYRACHIYITPAYAESFAHPLIEAMSSGLPVVAADLPVHREICGDAALYFPRFSPESLADRVIEIHDSPGLAKRLAANGQQRARDFSWSGHVDRLVSLAEELVSAGGRQGREAQKRGAQKN